MNPPMDDRRILAEMERRLARDDPDLASLMDALNGQFPTGHDDDRNDDGDRHGWRWKAAVVLAIVAVVAMILTAILARPPSSDANKGPPHGLPPAVSVQTQRRAPSRTDPGRRRPSPAGMGQLAQPPRTRQGRLMRARDLAESYTSVRNDADAVEAVRLLVEQQLPGLLVVDGAGQPYAILPACVVPGYVQTDPVLARVIDEPHADPTTWGTRSLGVRSPTASRGEGLICPLPLLTAQPWSSRNWWLVLEVRSSPSSSGVTGARAGCSASSRPRTCWNTFSRPREQACRLEAPKNSPS